MNKNEIVECKTTRKIQAKNHVCNVIKQEVELEPKHTKTKRKEN